MGLMPYLKAQITKAAEKKTVILRKLYVDRSDLIENTDIINEYVFGVMSMIRPTNCLEAAYNSTLIFEAIKEDPELKVKVFSQIDKNNSHNPWYFTNTSSIPINKLDKNAQLDGRILGVHFYNPPAVQKLVEVIKAENTQTEIVEFALEFIKKLCKKAVPSNDFAGFIGNGHFMRDALHAINEAQRLSQKMPLLEAIYVMNKVSQDYLIRPMGIFQLIDYVGIDVCSYIMSVMNPYLSEEDINSPILDEMIAQGILGGQYPSGAQKDGFLKYEKGRPAAIYDIEKKTYVPIEDFRERCDAFLGDLPESAMPWKAVNFSRNKAVLLEKYFNDLNQMDTLGVELAKAYNARSNEIGKKLVADKVANNKDDVNTVLLTGFYHAYGPINDYLK
jgi:3-hydroxyacyl-CoA dehydrogenase